MIVIADDTKLKDHLGAFALPVEVNKFAHDATAAALRGVFAQCGLSGAIALRGGETPFETDGGHFIYDCAQGKLMRRMNWRLHWCSCRVWLNTGCF